MGSWWEQADVAQQSAFRLVDAVRAYAMEQGVDVTSLAVLEELDRFTCGALDDLWCRVESKVREL